MRSSNTINLLHTRFSNINVFFEEKDNRVYIVALSSGEDDSHEIEKWKKYKKKKNKKPSKTIPIPKQIQFLKRIKVGDYLEIPTVLTTRWQFKVIKILSPPKPYELFFKVSSPERPH